MRILLIHQAFCGPNDPGGTRHYEIALRLVAQGHEVTIVTSRYSYLTGAKKTHCRYPDGIRVFLAPALSGLHKSYLQRILVFLSFTVSSFFVALRSGPQDVILGTSPPIFQCFSALAMALLRRRPFVLEVRDLWPDFASALGVVRNPLLIAAAKILEKIVYQFSNVVVVNSPAYKSYLRKAGVPESRIVVIPNGTNAADFNPNDKGDAFRAENGLANSFAVMYTGALGVANGAESIVEAAYLLRTESDVKFVVIGDGKHKSKLQREAQALGLENVLFLPAQPKKRMPEVLAAADVCVATLANIPSLQVTYPNKVFDYMAAGRPIVLAMEGPIREALQASDGGICVIPGDHSALAEAVRLLRRAPELRTEMGAKARAYVEQHFSRTEQANDFIDLLESIASPAMVVSRKRQQRICAHVDE